jgi:hypothetical protein
MAPPAGGAAPLQRSPVGRSASSHGVEVVIVHPNADDYEWIVKRIVDVEEGR